MHNAQRVLALVRRVAPVATATHAALAVVQGLLPLVTLYLTKLVVDTVASGRASVHRPAMSSVLGLIAALGFVALAGAAASAGSRYLSAVQAEALTNHMTDLIQSKSSEVDLAFYEDPDYLNVAHRAQQEAPYRPTQVVQALVGVAQAAVSLVAVGALLLTLHWSVGVVLVVTSVPTLWVRLRNGRRLFDLQLAATTDERRAWYYNWLLTSDTAAKELRLFDLGAEFGVRSHTLRARLRDKRLALTASRSRTELAADAISITAVFGLFAFVGSEAVRGSLTVGDLVLYLGGVQRAQAMVSQLVAGVSGLYEHNLFLSQVFDFLDLSPAITAPESPRTIARPIADGITLDGVSYRYPDSTREALHDVSLRIAAGQHIALVGQNGAGKTTLVKLLCRLYDPTGGRIVVDGNDLRDLSPAQWRHEIAVVFQDYACYHLSAAENIWLGDVARPLDDARVARAAGAAGAHSVIARLPQGYATQLGRWFDGGAELSIGEWQKIALARAFLRDAQVVILDEPSSALDAAAEEELFTRFHELAAGRTAILISHRLSTVRMADVIYVMEDGRIVESGTHAELTERRGRYATLFETQARPYRESARH